MNLILKFGLSEYLKVKNLVGGKHDHIYAYSAKIISSKGNGVDLTMTNSSFICSPIDK